MSDESLLQVARIAAGEFVMGAEDGEEDERPPHKAYVDDFAIGINPVTNAEYAQFVRETGHPSPAIRVLPLWSRARSNRTSARWPRRISGTTAHRPKDAIAIL